MQLKRVEYGQKKAGISDIVASSRVCRIFIDAHSLRSCSEENLIKNKNETSFSISDFCLIINRTNRSAENLEIVDITKLDFTHDRERLQIAK